MRFLLAIWLAIASLTSAAAAKPPTVATALGGLDPVLLVDGQEKMGEEDRAIVQGRYRYLFATADSRRRFEASPEEYSIQLDGACARMGPLSGLGAPHRYLIHDHRIYIFASEQCRTAFKSGPARFLDSPDALPQGNAAEQARGTELIDRALAGFGGADKVDGLSNYRLQTKISYGEGKDASNGLAILTVDFSGRVRSEQVWGDDRFSDVIDRDGGFQVQGTEWWPISEKSASYLRRSVYRSPLAVLRLRKEPGFTAFAAGSGKLGNTPVEYLKTGLGGATTTFAIDVASGRVLQSTHRGRYSMLGDVVRTFSEFREAQGLIVPHQINESFEGKPITSPVKSIESLTFNDQLDENLFRARIVRMTTPTNATSSTDPRRLRGGMVGMGMIFDETYRPFFEQVHSRGLYDRRFGLCEVDLAAVASRTGKRADAYRALLRGKIPDFRSFSGEHSVDQLIASGVDFVCVATPDNRHFGPARAALIAGKHLLVEKPAVLALQELDELERMAQDKRVLAKVVYHKLYDPDHKKLRTLVHDGLLKHVNNGYCSLLEPKQISGDQFSEWITGRNPGTYVAVHYIKLIDFTFGGRLKSVSCTGQRGIVGPMSGPTWDSTQLRLVYSFDDGREAAFDIHTSWVTPNNFPGYVEQEVQFRFDNGVWNGHSRKRGVECTVEDKTPLELKITMNNHYNGSFIEPHGERAQRGYGIEVIERFAREAAFVEWGGPPSERDARLQQMRGLHYNDLSADRQVVAAVQAMEAILARHVAGSPNCVVHVNEPRGGLVLYTPGREQPEVLYAPKV